MTQSRIGLIGGLSWQSTLSYYRYFHEMFTVGDNEWSAPKVIIDSLDFGSIVALQRADDWDGTGEILAHSAQRLEGAGATVLGIGANTMHINFDQVQRAVDIPVIDVRAVVASEALAGGHDTIALLGTKYVMERAFYSDKLEELGVRVIVPSAPQIDRLQTIIFTELTKGVVTDAARDDVRDIASSCRDRGATVVGLCCTEFGMLLEESKTIIDTTRAHVRALLASSPA
jgi:aspartate racemase